MPTGPGTWFPSSTWSRLDVVEGATGADGIGDGELIPGVEGEALEAETNVVAEVDVLRVLLQPSRPELQLGVPERQHTARYGQLGVVLVDEAD